MVQNLDFLKSRPEDDSFHRSRIMFCFVGGELKVSPQNTPESHLEWFRRGGWLNDENAQEFLKNNIRGFYLPKENKLYAYRSVGFDFDERVLPELLARIEDLKAAFGLNGETEIHLGPKDSPIYGKEYSRIFAGRIKELQNQRKQKIEKLLDSVVIDARDLPEAWFLCIKNLFDHGYEYKIDRGSFAGRKRLEFDFVTICIRQPKRRPLVPDVPQGVPAPTDMQFVENYLPYLMTAHKEAGEQYTYGQYLESQIPKVIEMYKKGGFETNQAHMTVGNEKSIELPDPPCLRGIDTRVRYGKLHFIVYFRSWDLWAGFPANLAAIQLLKEYMASEIGVEDGELIALSKGLHLYDHTWELAKQVVHRN